ncbi:SRPBCC family protein [Mucilaginibacter daejeonensis]|uniref:SRPBCC family protein n=1 Tax=Mucilaginibacter daejeonensis TaxID=398049 RepID=UPI001D177231|nr:SRPBCC family protein [Mucilaginibacter daejeonensis]UEG55166.1 SRPBCC family protein [Mucilaginibacter daejeonensis]
MLLKIFYVIGGLILLVLIVALFVKKDYTIEREIVIERPVAQVFDYVRYLKNQDNFSKWNMTDPGMKKAYKGTDGTVGFVYSWDSANKQVGKGEQELKNITDGQRVDMEVRFIKPFEGVASSAFTTESINAGSTKVKWSFKSEMPYPMNLARLFMNIEDMLGKDMDAGLVNLKRVLENK